MLIFLMKMKFIKKRIVKIIIIQSLEMMMIAIKMEMPLHQVLDNFQKIIFIFFL